MVPLTVKLGGWVSEEIVVGKYPDVFVVFLKNECCLNFHQLCRNLQG
jgi:hypothetical protein